jgi:TonB family protein
VARLREALVREPNAPDLHHQLATFLWEKANKDVTLTAGEKDAILREGIDEEDRALAVRPDYFEAIVYKNILMRTLARLVSSTAEQASLIAEADRLRDRAMAMQRTSARVTPPLPPPPPPPLAPASPFELEMQRLHPIRVGGNIQAPVKIHDVKATYPPEAQASRVSGVVILEVLVNPDGTIATARVLRSIPMLDDAALEAVRQWQYQPTLLNGQAVALVLTVTVNFHLDQ